MWRCFRIGTILVSLMALVGAWTCLSVAFPRSIPGALTVFEKAGEVLAEGSFFYHAGRTLYRVLGGFFLALLTGGSVGFLMGRRRLAEDFWRIWMIAGLTIPSLVWGMIAVICFKVSDWAPVTAVVAILAPILAQGVWQSTKAADADLLEMASAFRITGKAWFHHIMLPQLAPGLFAACRYGISLAWKVTVIAEMLGLSNGVGYQINYQFGLLRTDGVLAWTFLFAMVMGVIEYAIIYPLELYVTRWRRTAT